MKRGRLFVGLALIAGSLAWVGTRGLSGNLVYYRTPSEIVREGVAGDAVRLGGQVVPGSARETADGLVFLVTDGTTRISVVSPGGAPSLFRDGQGVVVEGRYRSDGAFHAENVFVKHGAVYRAPAPGATPTTARLEG